MSDKTAIRKPLAASLATILFLVAAGCQGTPQEREIAHIKRGNQYLGEKNYRKAVIEFKVASQNMPKDPEPQFLLAMTYLHAGATRLAVESFQKTLAIDPKHEGAQYQMALFEVGTNRMEMVRAAKQTLTDWIRNHPNDGEAFASLGLAEAKLGNNDDALRQLEAGAAKDLATFRVAGSVVALYAARGDVDAAKEVAKDLAEKLPNSPEAAVLRAQVALATNDLAGADAEIGRALSLKRDFRPALQLRLRREMMSGDAGDAEATTKELSELSEKRMWGAYARMLFGENRIDQGIAEYERALKEHNNDIELRDDYAATLLQAGRRKEAETVVAATLDKNPKDIPALTLRTILEIDRGSLDAAAQDIGKLHDMKVFSGQLSYQESRICLARGEAAREGDLLADALKRDPRMLVARLELTRLLVAGGKAKNGLVILDQAPPAQQRTIEFVFFRNMTLIAAGYWDQARKGVDAALAVARVPGFLYQDAVLRMQTGDVAGARKSLEAAFQMAPADQPTIAMLGEVMRQQKEFPKYVELVKQAAARYPSSTALQSALGSLLAAQGDAAGAQTAYNAAKAGGDPVNPEIDMALLDLRSGAVDKAKNRLLELVKAHDNVRARIILADIEMRSGSGDGPVEQYLKALQLEPANVFVMNNLAGYLATRRKKYDDALFWGRKALALAPDSPVVEDTLGWTYYLQGKYDAALPYLEKSEKAMDRPVAHYHMAAELMKAGDKARAKKEFEAALRADPNSSERAVVGPLFADSSK
jgi:tetratricopeptide (TPR) repeat protein